MDNRNWWPTITHDYVYAMEMPDICGPRHIPGHVHHYISDIIFVFTVASVAIVFLNDENERNIPRSTPPHVIPHTYHTISDNNNNEFYYVCPIINAVLCSCQKRRKCF